MFEFNDLTNVLLIAACLGGQYFLASRQHVLFGIIIPATFLIWRISIFFTTESSLLKESLIIFVGLVFLLGQWFQGRKAVKIKQEKELRKMKAYDL